MESPSYYRKSAVGQKARYWHAVMLYLVLVSKSLVRHQLPSLCVGMLRPGQGMGGGCSSSREGGRRWIAECLTNAAKVDLGVEMAILLIECNSVD